MDIRQCFPNWDRSPRSFRQRLRRYIPNVSHPPHSALGNSRWGPQEEASYQHFREATPYTNTEIADAYKRLALTTPPNLARAYLRRAIQLRKGWRISKKDLRIVAPQLAAHARLTGRQQRQPTEQDIQDYLKVTGRKPKPVSAQAK